MHLRRVLCCLLVMFATTAVFAQQTGAFHGRVTASDGSALPGVTVEARSNVLPQPRVTVTDGNGDYRLPQLQPGSYTLTFTLAGMQTATRKGEALLDQDIAADVKMVVGGVSENITVTAQATLVDKESTAIQTGLTNKQIQELPVAQNYGDLQKLIPGVMVTQDVTRGPSAGASGQDNVYLFDGVNVTMPLFGVLVAEPATHDIAQYSVTRGGAKAVDFNRASGLLVDSVSKSGTNKFSGEVSYQFLKHGMVADQVGNINSNYQRDNDWTDVNLGGPIVSDHLFFYGSYYRPISKRNNQSNLYGALPEFTSKRSEEFGKLTFTPTSTWLINGSYRNSHRTDTSGDAFGSFRTATTGSGSETRLRIGTLEGSKVVNPKSFATFKFTDFRNPGFGQADFFANTNISTVTGTHLDLNNLDKIGRLVVPTPLPGNTAQNAFIAPFVNQYGYVCPQNPAATGLTCIAGQRTGGGTVGLGQFAHDDDSFYRKSGQIGYNYTLGTAITHDLHIGYQRYNDSEDRFQTSNGWGLISIPAGTGVTGSVCPASVCGTAKNAYFVAAVNNASRPDGVVPVIHSEFHSQAIELNDSIHMNAWTFNVGFQTSQDILYGQGLKKADNIAGFVSSPGTKYKMHEFGFSQLFMPRLGATWSYNGTDTVYASIARYNPAANSDARAASWDRNLQGTINAYFDANGNLMGFAPNASSSGKLFQDGIRPPRNQEYLLGTSKQFSQRWSGRFYTRYRHGTNFMEDTNNTARSDFQAPPGIPTTPYIPNLGSVSTPGTLRNAIGSGSSYVIANLDGAFTRYYEATAESQWRGDRLSVTASYTWSHYYGNFDQDDSSFNTANDAAVFIGSSNIGDGAGRQLWNFKYGDLRGDRRNVVKLFGTYDLAWSASVGAYFLFQSGQPYQLESNLPYRVLGGNTSDTNRYAEPAGTRKSPSYRETDLNYTQRFPLTHGLNLQLKFDVFNLFNNQAGYNYETRVGTLGFTTRTDIATVDLPASIPVSLLPAGTDPRSKIIAPYANSNYAPRRLQVAAAIQF